MSKSIGAAFLLLVLATVSLAQEASQHPIDKALDACIDKNGSTAGMAQCEQKAYQSWDNQLNKTYRELMLKMKPAQKEILRAAQLEWIKQRNADFKLIDSIYDTLQGTMYIPMRVDAHVAVVKKRALQLKDYLDLTSDAEP